MSVTDSLERVRAAFRDSFGASGAVVRSPGRVNLIGEHTDHNLGFVLPAAVDRAIYLAIRLRDDRALRFVALDKDDRFEGSLDELRPVAVRVRAGPLGQRLHLGPGRGPLVLRVPQQETELGETCGHSASLCIHA